HHQPWRREPEPGSCEGSGRRGRNCAPGVGDLHHRRHAEHDAARERRERAAAGAERTSGLVAGRDFGIACNPEFLREGTAVADFFGAEITVIGAGDPRSAAALSAMYQGVGGDVVVTAIRTAEMLKYVNNAFHALKVSFANEVGRWARREGVDSHEVMRLFCRDTRLNLS